MHILGHEEPLLAKALFAPLVTVIVFSGCYAMEVTADKIPRVTVKAAVVCRSAYDMTIVAMTIKTAGHVAASAVTGEKFRVGPTPAASDKGLFPATHSHGMIEQSLEASMTTTAATGPILTGCGVCHGLEIISVAGATGKSRMDTRKRLPVAVPAVLSSMGQKGTSETRDDDVKNR
jgi:hypothetical protein